MAKGVFWCCFILQTRVWEAPRQEAELESKAGVFPRKLHPLSPRRINAGFYCHCLAMPSLCGTASLPPLPYLGWVCALMSSLLQRPQPLSSDTSGAKVSQCRALLKAYTASSWATVDWAGRQTRRCVWVWPRTPWSADTNSPQTPRASRLRQPGGEREWGRESTSDRSGGPLARSPVKITYFQFIVSRREGMAGEWRFL